jgi:hypothetical protein
VRDYRNRRTRDPCRSGPRHVVPAERSRRVVQKGSCRQERERVLGNAGEEERCQKTVKQPTGDSSDRNPEIELGEESRGRTCLRE